MGEATRFELQDRIWKPIMTSLVLSREMVGEID